MLRIKSSKHFVYIFCILTIFLGINYQNSVSAQNDNSLPKDWYCDKRLELLPNLRRGKVKNITKLEQAGWNDLIIEFISGNNRYKTVNIISVEFEDLYTGSEKNEAYRLLNVSAGKIKERQFKIGESYLFEIKKLGLNYIGKGTYNYEIQYIPPDGYFRDIIAAQSDIDFLQTAAKAKENFDILGIDKSDGKVISGGIINGKAVNLVKPAYPKSAKTKNASETIKVAVLIDENGSVNKASAYCYQNEDLAKSAENAALISKFSPTIMSGKAVKVRGIILYVFNTQ